MEGETKREKERERERDRAGSNFSLENLICNLECILKKGVIREDCVGSTHDRDYWRAIMYVVLNLRVS